jgi:hypothetical protein
MKSFKTWLEDTHDEPRDFSPDELGQGPKGGSHKFEVEEIGYVKNRPAIPGLPFNGDGTGENEIYQIVYDIDFTMAKGMKGQYSKADFGVQMTPDDPDEYEITHNDPVEVNHEKLDENHPILKTFNITLNKLEEILVKYFNDYLHDEALEQVVGY